MTTNEYLARLKSCLECIDASEREAAVQFYTEYFEDAGEENAEKVMAELGSPEKLARDIIKQSAGSAPTRGELRESLPPGGGRWPAGPEGGAHRPRWQKGGCAAHPPPSASLRLTAPLQGGL